VGASSSSITSVSAAISAASRSMRCSIIVSSAAWWPGEELRAVTRLSVRPAVSRWAEDCVRRLAVGGVAVQIRVAQ
jgi:hypothetical protein